MNRTALVGNNFSLVHGPIIRFEENKHYNKISSSNTPKRAMIAASQGITYERQVALDGLSADEVLHLLNYKSLYQILDKNVPTSTSSIISRLNDYHLCEQEGKKWNITNMGAILFANNLGDFPNMKGREVIVRKYVGTNNRQQSFEQHGAYGYAVGFEGLVDFIMRNTSKEVIDVKREEISVYPRVAIREFVANALCACRLLQSYASDYKGVYRPY